MLNENIKQFLKRLLPVVVLFMLIISANAQVGILTYNPHSSAALEVYSLNKGILIPRITLSNDLNTSSPVSSPANGLLVFNTGPNQTIGFYYWSGSKWVLIKTPNADEVSGPANSTDNAIVRFDGTSGKIIQNSDVIIDDNDQISQVNSLEVAEFKLTTSPSTGLILVSDINGNAAWETAPPVDVKEDNVLVTANVDKLNFESGIKVYDEGNNQAKMVFFKKNVTNDVIQVSSIDSTDLNNLTSFTPIVWNLEREKNAMTFNHSITTNPERISVNRGGIYEVNFMFSIVNKTIMRKTLRAQLRKNGSTFIDHVTSYSFSYHEEDDKVTHASSSFLIELNQNDYIELVINGQTNPGPIRLRPYENLFFMRFIRSN
ncbi:MAG: hypothetical protein C0598_06645 [Marinilabiliales bacterium]|nr:MAG: hypothetical protein C0598_06645 [Marinilabiliales bacterium]